MEDDKGHHVHFSEDTDAMGNTAITVKEKTEGEFEAHVGFLQINHRYHIDITVPVKDADDGYKIAEPHGVYCHALELQVTESGALQVSFELLAHKEKLLREKIHLLKPTEGQLIVTILARVLGKGKGTPMLRDNIKCVGIDADDESEASDWQGFS
ncbi:adipose-secreted signaling protein-like [Macrobrachium nipponense]|uniref:adipose-secreted signaling protein-like n=1 Tax=Macrobrachium nipponense TaxID=159736 RepID=UPI0030C896A5